MSELEKNTQFDKYGTENEMKKYILMHSLEAYKDYSDVSSDMSSEERKEKENLAKYIYNNYDKMDEIEMKCIAMKCLELNQIKRILLSHELENYKEKGKTMSLDEFHKQVLKYLHRYQHKAGGFLMEDTEWKVTRFSDENNYDLLENEILFSNTLDKSDVNDEETYEYIRSLVRRLNMLAKNIEVTMTRLFREGDKVAYILLWGTDKNITNVSKKSEIGL